MKFIIFFIKAKKADLIYKERAKLIISTFPEKIKENPEIENCTLVPHIVDMFQTSAEVWSKCFNEIPSAFGAYDSDQCGKYINNVPTVFFPKQRELCEERYIALKKYLGYISTSFETSCFRCGNKCNINRAFNNIYILN